MSEWKPIETAPKTTKAILVYVPENKCTFQVSWDANDYRPGWKIFGGDYRSYLSCGSPTHWMSLPDPPTPETR